MIELYNGDCLEVLPTLTKQVDAIITDLPYNATACDWDAVIPFGPMWEQVKRLLKPTGAFVTTATQPFETSLIMSNMEWFKYVWVWLKSKPNGWQHAKNRPMPVHEDVVVFSPASMGHESLLGDERMIYNPQGTIPSGEKEIKEWTHGRTIGKRPNQIGKAYMSFTNFPSSLLFFPGHRGKASIHPTQKPTDLYEYLIRTYTNEGETVLDFCCGVGTTGEACVKTGRNFIGIELDKGYFEIAQKRVAEAQQQLRLL